VKFKNILIVTVLLLVMSFIYCPASLSGPQKDKFQAEGLTEPVVPNDGGTAVKVTFPHTDCYMLFDPP
jgi:hypothetical protein